MKKSLYTVTLNDFLSISVRQHGLMQGNIIFKVFYLNKKFDNAKMGWKLYEFTFHAIFATIKSKILCFWTASVSDSNKEIHPKQENCLILPKKGPQIICHQKLQLLYWTAEIS